VVGDKEELLRKIAQRAHQLEDIQGLRSWLGIINYARSYLPKCGTLLGPLYNKLGTHGDKRWKESDFALVRQVKAMVKNLPALKLPPHDAELFS
jgi:hypothetical protein